ncbi:addiction module toxin, RelE/StbE family [Nitrosococcus halophilus Nc 4]|uniref:Addiction module toxin, RelE/StbE family n=1 Tax=Nitrosococcus halophilus (strain Nc4) TaxID=472759 RepID=D5BWF5_NITHN|nr:type II toxin-antitoxin system RelE/ParE family toxin [Nitrosococcus halophilus]ADE15612.1 addiction module toxin, RelE/StbE family [Nitrosococcus halophilus Nc 4]
MAWQIELSGLAQKNLHGLDKQIAERILRFLNDRIAKLDDPRSIGDPLKGAKLGEFWKYRVGDYRIIADIQDSELLILVVRIGNRREVYKR